jgi:hypothetical protein
MRCQRLPCDATWQQVGSTAASKVAETGQCADLPAQTLMGPVGLEPTTYGLKERQIPVQNVGDPPIRAWFVDAG